MGKKGRRKGKRKQRSPKADESRPSNTKAAPVEEAGGVETGGAAKSAAPAVAAAAKGAAVATTAAPAAPASPRDERMKNLLSAVTGAANGDGKKKGSDSGEETYGDASEVKGGENFSLQEMCNRAAELEKDGQRRQACNYYLYCLERSIKESNPKALARCLSRLAAICGAAGKYREALKYRHAEKLLYESSLLRQMHMETVNTKAKVPTKVSREGARIAMAAKGITAAGVTPPVVQAQAVAYEKIAKLFYSQGNKDMARAYAQKAIRLRYRDKQANMHYEAASSALTAQFGMARQLYSNALTRYKQQANGSPNGVVALPKAADTKMVVPAGPAPAITPGLSGPEGGGSLSTTIRGALPAPEANDRDDGAAGPDTKEQGGNSSTNSKGTETAAVVAAAAAATSAGAAKGLGDGGTARASGPATPLAVAKSAAKGARPVVQVDEANKAQQERSGESDAVSNDNARPPRTPVLDPEPFVRSSSAADLKHGESELEEEKESQGGGAESLNEANDQGGSLLGGAKESTCSSATLWTLGIVGVLAAAAATIVQAV